MLVPQDRVWPGAGRQVSLTRRPGVPVPLQFRQACGPRRTLLIWSDGSFETGKSDEEWMTALRSRDKGVARLLSRQPLGTCTGRLAGGKLRAGFDAERGVTGSFTWGRTWSSAQSAPAAVSETHPGPSPGLLAPACPETWACLGGCALRPSWGLPRSALPSCCVGR